jgi:hypothetical protein
MAMIVEPDENWANWSEANELARKKLHDDVLANTIGQPPYRYPWGEIQSMYDPRSGGSSISIHYS